MKTSTKILITAFAVLLTAIITLLIYINLNIVDDKSLEKSGILNAQVREVPDFTAINAISGMEIILVQDTFRQVKVVADKNIINKIATDVKDGVLQVSVKSDTATRNGIFIRTTYLNSEMLKNVKVYVTFKELNKIRLSEGISLTCNNTIHADSMAVEIENGVKGNLNVNAGNMSITMLTGAIMNISGTAETVNLVASTGCEINAENFNGKKMDISASTGSAIKVGIFESLNIEASTGSVVKYKKGSHLGFTDINNGAKISEY